MQEPEELLTLPVRHKIRHTLIGQITGNQALLIGQVTGKLM